jgi:hypothetical protein
MKKIIFDEPLVAGPLEEGVTHHVTAPSYRIIDWFEPREWTTYWVEHSVKEDTYPTYHHTYNNDRGIFTGPTLSKSSPYLGMTITEKRGHVKEWTDDETGQRMAEVEWEYRTRRV